jgi:23S rRNA pseudouridine1911/1915/1917 synthase
VNPADRIAPKPGVVRYVVHPEVAGQRLDQGLAALAVIPRRRVRALVADGRLWLNGRATRVLSRQLHLADVLDVVPEDEALAPPPPAPPDLPILFEDGWLVAADKAAGLTTQPPRRRAPGELTAHERVLLQLAARDGKRVEVMLFHRLDRLTTGVLVFARQRDAARALAKIWGSGAVQKQYLALVRGGPGKGPRRISGAIASDPLVHGRFRVARNGKPATTEVRLLARLAEFSLVEVRPLTGRTHQVRVHLAEAGFPVAGDALYGGAGGVPRPFLHSWRLTIPHPRTGRQLRLEAPVPADMQRFLAGLGVAVDAVLPR